VIVADHELHHAERTAGDEAGGPDLEHAPPACLGGDQPERHEQREDRQLAADHRAEIVQVEPGERREGGQRDAERAEGNGGGVADEGELGGLEGLEAQADHEGAGDGDGRAEAGGALDERAEAEGDQQRLDAAIAGHAGDLFLQDGELAGLDRELVDEDRVEDEPADGQEAERGAVAGGGEGERGRHAVGEDRDGEGDAEGDEGRDVRAHVPESQQAEQDDDRDGGDQGRPAEVTERGVVLGPGHIGRGRDGERGRRKGGAGRPGQTAQESETAERKARGE
jgi:hypothetical protein